MRSVLFRLCEGLVCLLALAVVTPTSLFGQHHPGGGGHMGGSGGHMMPGGYGGGHMPPGGYGGGHMTPGGFGGGHIIQGGMSGHIHQGGGHIHQGGGHIHQGGGDGRVGGGQAVRSVKFGSGGIGNFGSATHSGRLAAPGNRGVPTSGRVATGSRGVPMSGRVGAGRPVSSFGVRTSGTWLSAGSLKAGAGIARSQRAAASNPGPRGTFAPNSRPGMATAGKTFIGLGRGGATVNASTRPGNGFARPGRGVLNGNTQSFALDNPVGDAISLGGAAVGAVVGVGSGDPAAAIPADQLFQQGMGAVIGMQNASQSQIYVPPGLAQAAAGKGKQKPSNTDGKPLGTTAVGTPIIPLGTTAVGTPTTPLGTSNVGDKIVKPSPQLGSNGSNTPVDPSTNNPTAVTTNTTNVNKPPAGTPTTKPYVFNTTNGGGGLITVPAGWVSGIIKPCGGSGFVGGVVGLPIGAAPLLTAVASDPAIQSYAPGAATAVWDVVNGIPPGDDGVSVMQTLYNCGYFDNNPAAQNALGNAIAAGASLNQQAAAIVNGDQSTGGDDTTADSGLADTTAIPTGLAHAAANNEIHGMQITKLSPTGAARRDGLMVGDVILAVGNKPTPTLEALRAVLESNRGMAELEVIFLNNENGKVERLPLHPEDTYLGAEVEEVKVQAGGDPAGSTATVPTGLTHAAANNEVHGMQITKLSPTGAAKRDGLMLGDVILAVGNKPTPTLEALRAVLESNRGVAELEVIFLNNENGKVERLPLHPEDTYLGAEVEEVKVE